MPGVFLTDYRKMKKNNNKKLEKKTKEITEEKEKEKETTIELEKEIKREKEIEIEIEKTEKENKKEKLQPLTHQPIKKRIVDPLDLQLIDSKFMDFKLNQLLTEIKMLVSSNKQIREFDPKGEDLDFVQAIKENENIIVQKKKEYKELQELTKSKIFSNKINPKRKPKPKKSNKKINNKTKKNINNKTKKKINQDIKKL
ncbi:hypothetical protein M0813_18854 [Anaeramoeba flamelloides]|uniref:Uncharacterized protein n=1 Tax=Anaeramoeba flamelloides TaxID=1746091 RepID=A0ABQ8YRT4_9EUKA|nr:hypothetical protein M0813_18854 [Anaeramoeba flamelloides]